MQEPLLLLMCPANDQYASPTTNYPPNSASPYFRHITDRPNHSNVVLPRPVRVYSIEPRTSLTTGTMMGYDICVRV